MLALSVKQPWAALLVHGLKTIEVRRWATEVRGRVLIHAARIPDERPQAWALVPDHLAAAVRLRGGIIGQGELIDCRPYRTLEQFLGDQPGHLNDPSWFEPRRLHGFHFANLSVLPFRRVPGNVRFFDVPEETPIAPTDGLLQAMLEPDPLPVEIISEQKTTLPADRTRTRLLVSVRTPAEAAEAVAAGADLIDVKEPERGSLGRAEDEMVAAVVAVVAGRVPVSAALGELRDGHVWRLPALGLRYVKCGLAGCRARPWRRTLLAARPVLPAELVFVAYADADSAEAPPVEEVGELARELAGTLLIDTHDKTPRQGKRPGLLDFLTLERLASLIEKVQATGGQVALAGSLDEPAIRQLLPLRPDWIAVRGAACLGAERSAAVSAERVRALAQLLNP